MVNEDQTPRQYRNKFMQVCSFILVMEMCERLAYYTFQTNLTIYIQKNLGYSSTSASMYSSLFSSLVYITPLIGAYVADALIGRYATILIFSVSYIFGLYLLAISSLPSIQLTWMFFVSLFFFICLGAGGIKANVVTLGADQFNPVTEVEQMNSYFNYFYWAVNLGSIIATAYLSDFALNGSSLISQTYSFSASFFIAAALFTIALITFLAGRKRYVTKEPEGSAFTTFFAIVFYAARSSISGILLLIGFGLLSIGVLMNIVLVFVHSSIQEPLTILTGILVLSGILLCIFCGKSVDWVHTARDTKGWTNDQVTGAWELLRLFPYIGFMIAFWTVYMCMGGPWTNQGCQMDCRVFTSSQYNPGSFGLWDCVSILVFIPIFDKWVYPFVGRLIGNPKGPTQLQKIGCGLGVTIFCMILAGIVEIQRKKAAILPGLASICNSDSEPWQDRPVSDFSLWYQLPQYIVLGIAEILASITAYDLFYTQVPDNMKSACQGLNLLTTALGATVNTMLQNIMTSEGWLPDNLNDGHQEYFYFAVAAIGVVFLILFIIFSQSFQYKETDTVDLEDAEMNYYVPGTPLFQQSSKRLSINL